MSKLSACDREWKSRRDDDGSIHLELWDNFLDEWQIVGTVVKDENGFTGQVFDHRPFTFTCLLYTSPSPRDVEESRMPSSA